MLYWNLDKLCIQLLAVLVEPKQMLYWNYCETFKYIRFATSNRNKCCIEIKEVVKLKDLTLSRTETNIVLKFCISYYHIINFLSNRNKCCIEMFKIALLEKYKHRRTETNVVLKLWWINCPHLLRPNLNLSL